MMSDFSKIQFGYSSAETERAEDPGLLLDGYIDLKEVSKQARSGPKFLFLGYKGTGKSALAERLTLESEEEYHSFIKLVQLKDFPFTPFSKIIRGDAEPEFKFPIAWSWIILIYLLESFASDHGVTHHDSKGLQDAIEAFRAMGLSPTGEPGKIVRASSKNNFRIALPGRILEADIGRHESKPASEIPDFVDNLKELISGVRSDSTHHIVIDGLDDILTSREVQFKSLSALVFEVARLNSSFRSTGVPAKIVLLCRTDLFERIPGANKNKLRQDHSVEMDWYHDPSDPNASMLISIANKRASRSLERQVDIFTEFLKSKIDGSDARTYLLDMTRHTPRDFLQLLTYIQEIVGDGTLSEKSIKSGMRNYSIKYFLPEIQDEMSGYATPDEIATLFDLISRVRKRDFFMADILKASKGHSKILSEERIFDMLKVLFECSGIGNIQKRRGPNGDTTFYTFKFRNRHSSFNDDEGIMLHKGLWKAMNLM